MKQRIVGGVLALLVVVAAVFRLWEIDTLPPGFHFDESFEGLEAWRILTDPTYRPVFLTGNFGVAPLNAYANAAMFALFGWLGWRGGADGHAHHRGVGWRARACWPSSPSAMNCASWTAGG
jgi:hypothetical protein